MTAASVTLGMPEILWGIARYSTPETVIGLAGTSKAAQDALNLEVRAARFDIHAPEIDSPSKFDYAIGKLSELPNGPFRCRALLRIGLSILSYQGVGHQAWCESWLALATEQWNPEILESQPYNLWYHVQFVLLGLAASSGIELQAIAPDIGSSPETLEDWLVHGVAGEAVRKGRNVSTVMQAFGITMESSRFLLEALSADGPAGKAVQQGLNVVAAMHQFGITMVAPQTTLEILSVIGPALEAAQQGQSIDNVTQRFGINLESSRGMLEFILKNPEEFAASLARQSA